MANTNSFFGSLFDAPTSDVSLPKDLALPEAPVRKQEAPEAPKVGGKSERWLPPADMTPIFEAAAKEFNVPVNVLMALGHQESRYNANAVGQPTQWGRAKGIMQYIDDTAAQMGINPFDPAQAIPAAAKQLSERLRKGYSMEDAVKEHFAGPDRKKWGEKTAAYGREVMEKVGRIGSMIGGGGDDAADLQSRLDAEEPGRYRVMTNDQAATKFSPAMMSRDAYEQTFRNNNQGASQAAVDYALSEYDRTKQAQAKGAISGIDQRFDTLKSADATFDNNLNGRLQGPANGIVPQLPGKLASAPQEQGIPADESVTDAVKRNAGYMGDNLKIGWNNLLNSFEGMRSNEYGELIEAFKRSHTPEQVAADPTLQERIKGYEDGFARSMATIAERNKENEALQAQGRPETKQFFSAGGKPTMEQLSIIGDAVMKNPVGVIADLGVQSGPQSIAMIAAAVLARFTGAGTTGAALAGGSTSAALQFGSDYAALRESGESHNDAWTKAATKAPIVGAFDALSLKSAGKAMDTVLSSTGKAGVLGTAKSVASKAGTVAVETGKQAGYGMAGEGFGSLASGRTPEPVDVIAEGLGEVIGAPGEAISMRSKRQAAQPSEPSVDASAGQVPNAPAPQSVVTPVPAQTSTAAGPLSRAVEKAADQDADQPPRAEVKTPNGTITGFVESMQDDGNGGFTARILADDGQVYTFTEKDGVQIAVEQKQPAGPLTSAVEKVAEQSAEVRTSQTENQPAEIPNGDGITNKPEAKPEIPVVEQNQQVEQSDVPSAQAETAPAQAEASKQAEQIDLTGRTDQQLQYLSEKGQPGFKESAIAEIERRKQAAPEPRLEDMDEPQLRARMKYIAGQAKANGGWNKLLTTERRKVEAQINKLTAAKAGETDGRNAADLQVRDVAVQSPAAVAAVKEDQQGAGARGQGTDAGGATAAGSPVSGAATSVPGADVAADADTALKIGDTAHFVAGPYAGAQGEVVEVKPSGSIVLKANNEIGSRLMGRPEELQAGQARIAEEPKKAKAKQPNGADSKKAEALFEAPQRDEYAGKWFGSKEKAEAFITKKKAGATHEVVQTGKVRFEVKPKATDKESLTVQADSADQNTIKKTEAAPTEPPAPAEAKKPVSVRKVSDGVTAIVIDPSAMSPTDTTPPKGGKPAVSENKVFTEDAAAKARALLKSRLSGAQLNSGIDPEIMQAGITLAGYHIEKGARTFSAYAQAMLADLGDAVKPYLKSWYMGVKYDPRAASFDGMSTAAEVEGADIDAMLEKPAASPTIEVKEPQQNDTKPTQTDAGTGVEGQAAGPVREDEGGRDAGRNAEPDVGERGAGDGGDARSAGKRQAVPGDQRPAAEGAGSQQPAEGGRGSRAEPVDRGNRKSAVSNYRIQPGELKREGSWRATAERNVQVVELVKRIESEGRQATADERALMAKFTGWGASEIANGIFPDQYGRYKNADWQALGERLKAALTDEEYSQAKRTTQYAHYTSEGIISGIWGAFQRLGFAGGSLVEPGMGIGHFNGLMPDGIAANSNYTGIEYDTITGMIAKALYPASNVIIGDYTRTNLPKDFFDAAIGNPPFSQTQVLNDPEYKNRRPMLHDYFFMKTIDRVKPGGLLVFVTSKGTMDKTSDKSRKYLGERANLLGAIRLPQTAFKDNAGTEVVTDVIFLQKRGDGIADNGVAWMDTKEVQTPQGPASINEYFADNPAMVLGTNALTGSMYRANEYTVLPLEGNIEDHFAAAVQKLPENVARAARGSTAERSIVQDRDFNPKHKKEGGLYVGDDGKLMQVESGSGVELTHRSGSDGKRIALTPKQKQWLKGYVGVRDALKQTQYDQLNDGPWEKSLKDLNKAYDAFVKANGPILDFTVIERTAEDGTVTETKRLKNAPLFQSDVEGALVYALETIKENGTIEKGAALKERVLERHRDPEIKTTQDAMFVSLNRLGSLNLDDVAALAGTDRDSIIRDLDTAIYDAPGKGWQLADEYLSGNVVRKLKEAQAAADINPTYKRNVEALLAVQPRPLGPTEITVRLGANWVPPSDVAAFASEVLGDRMDITYSPIVGRWSVDQKTRSVSEWAFDRMAAGETLESVLNSRQIKVTFRDSEGKTHVDVESTEKANDIAAKMRERFRTWVWSDTKRADRLVKFYNENFNNIAPRSFDGSHLTLPGVSARFKLYPHQKRAVWRIIQQGDTYLAHAVGAGKTMEMIAAGMEERRLGLINKPMYVVPNHMLAQFSREFLELYPAANIMVADENNFHSHNRKRFVAQAALNNPDAIIITHSAFGRISMSDEFSAKFIEDQIDEWKAALDDVDKGDRITVKQIERRIEQLERRLEGKQGKDKKDKVLDFEELGVDKLYVDEFHEFRKLDFATNQGSVKGIDPNGSQRALDLNMKAEYLRGKKPGRALVAASGTPVTNTMGELFTAQRFFQPEQLREDGLDTFDAWSAQYGDIVTGFEQNAAGGYEMVSRFAKFQNVPELMRRVRSFMDILTSSNLGELVKRPDVIGGGREVVVTPVPDGYKEYQQSLQSRIQAIRRRKGPPKKGEDIILNVIADGRFSAIDMRFVDPTRPSDPSSKLNLWIDDIINAYKETAGYEFADKVTGKADPIKGASVIGFSDIGLGEASAANRGFDMRAWIEKRLADAGIPKDHIAFMRDHKQSAKKERLFADMREGKKRILIGGKEMETGTNVQKRLTHLFHLDAPWFPASVEQREGRIIRQGNQNKNVKINAYATKGSYDSTMWGMNARKARFIEQAMNGDDNVRSLEDVSEASAFEMAAALASGDERYLKLAGLKTDVERLERLRHAHYQDQNSLRRDKHWSEESIVRNEAKAKELKEAIGKRKTIRAGEFYGLVGKASFDNREEYSQAIFKAFKKLGDDNHVGDKTIGEIGGFPVVFYGTEMKGSGEYVASLHVSIPGDPDALASYPVDPDFAVAGIATRAANQVNGMDRELATAERYISESKRKIEQINARLGATFPEEAILLEKVAELSALEEELAAEGEPANADAAAATVETEEVPKFSVAAMEDQAKTPAFKRWFGDSKVVDANGEPLVVYHGTNKKFTKFDIRKFGKTDEGMSGKGFYFAANEFATDPYGRYTVPVYLSLKNPYVHESYETLGDAMGLDSAEITDRLIADGYDGVIAKNEDGEIYEYVAFRPEQIKSATDNNGDFDPTNPDIRYSVNADGNTVAEFGPVLTEYKDNPAAAIERLMADKAGEAIVSRPDIGDISLIYGDDGAGLQHIAERRGADFMERLPDLITDGVIYTKPNQKGRVFIGNNRDEAVIRLDWNGEAKTWLLSAYEKYPDLTKAGDVQQSRRSQTVEQRTDKPMTADDLRKAIRVGATGAVIDELVDFGTIVLHDTHKTLPKDVGKNVRGIQAVTMPDGTIHMVANAVSRDNANGVLLHEMFHRGGEKLIGSEEWSKMMGRLGSLYRQAEQSEGMAREFFDKARDRVAAARKQGAVPIRMEVEEFAAYAIEEYQRAPESMPAAIRKWVADLIGMVKAWMVKRYGKQIGAVTPAQLAAFAKLAVMDVAIARRGEMFGPIGELFSAQDVTKTQAFKRWFGDSKVVDANGEPLVVYHGTNSEFNVFDRKKQREGRLGKGFYFTSSEEEAKTYGNNVIPVYLKIDNLYNGRTRERDGDGKNHGIEYSITRGGGRVFIVIDPRQIKSATSNNGDFDPANPDIRYSVAPEQADQALTEATDALQAKDDFIGGVVGDLGMTSKALLHPRQIAAIFPQFTPVYRTGVSQIETRDAHVAELGAGMGAYDALPQESKEKVNKVLELGRLVSKVFSDKDLADGVTNTGSRTVVALDEKGKPKATTVPVEAVLTGKGEVVKLTADEIKAYNDLRVMFDRALDMMRDQTLEDMGYGQFAGEQNAAKAIMDTITKDTPPEQAERIANVAKYVAEIEQAKRAGYVPFARYGDYVVTVKEKIADVSFVEDDTEHLIAQGLPESFAGDLLDLGAEKVKEGWRIKKSQKRDVERLTEKTVYSAKIETGLRDMLAERNAGTVEDIKAVKDAIEAARKEWVGDNPARRVVAFKTKDQIADGPVNLTDVAALAELSSIDNATWDMVHEKLIDAQKARGFRRHLIHSDNVPGYTGDFERAMADYVISMAGYLSRRQHMKRWENSVSSITEQPRLHKYATAYRDYLNNPQEELAMVRQIGFFSYIAGVPMSAFANLTQVPIMTVPTLAQVAPMPLVMKEVTRAYKDALAMVSTGNGLDMFDPNKAPDDVRQALKEAWDEGSFVPLETYDLMMTARQRNVGRRKGAKAFNTATQVISMTFTFAERMNRLVTFIAAARIADKPAVKANANRVLGKDALARAEVLRNWNPKSFAEWAVDESQYRMGKANRPTVMRGVGSAIMQFKGFMLQTFEAWYRMVALHGKDGKFAAVASIATLYAFAGLWGMPGADDLRKLIENIYKQITDKDLDMKTELRAFIARVSGSNAIAQIVNKGVTYPLGLDMTRVGMGSIVPDSPLAAAGIPFDMLIGRPKRAFEKASVGDYWSASGELAPNFIKHPLVAAGWATQGVRDKQGNRILLPSELSKANIAMKALGAQPSIVTDIRDYEYAQRRQETAVDALKRRFVNKIARTIGEMESTKDEAKLKELDDRLTGIYQDLADHNETASPEQFIKIDQRSLRNKIVREMDGVKSTWGKERKAARGAADELRGTFGLQEEDE